MRTNLAAVILKMLNLKLGDIQKFPFVQRPDQKQINDGYALLFELGAVDRHRRITRPCNSTMSIDRTKFKK